METTENYILSPIILLSPIIISNSESIHTMKHNPDSLEERFRTKGFQEGGVLMFTPAVTLEFIAAAEKEGFNILGIDGFLRTDEWIQPNSEHSIDFTSKTEGGFNVTQRALKFVKDREQLGLHFEVVIGRS